MLVPKSFTDLMTFSRASGGWYFNSAGVLAQAAANIPRFEYDPVTRQPLGLLIEEARTNLLPFSSQFDNAAWSSAGAHVTPASTIAPDGTAGSFHLHADAGVTLVGASIFETVTKATSPIKYTGSVFAKKAEFDRLRLFLHGANTSTARCICDFDLSAGTGTVSAQGTSGFSDAIAMVEDTGAGWFRCAVSVSSDSNASVSMRLYALSSGVTAGDGVSGIYIFGAQLEEGAFPTSYIRTTGAQAARSEDVAELGNVTPWYAAVAWTTFVDWAVRYPVVGNRGPFWLNRNTVVRGIGIYYPSALVVRGMYRADDGQTLETPSVPAATRNRAAFSFKDNAVTMSVNGAAAVTNSVASIGTPSVDRLRLGYYRASGANTGSINGHLRAFRFWPYRLSNAELQALTA